MGLSTAVRGFVAIILSISVIHGQTSWGVNYSSSHICALKGSTVNMSSTFRYPQMDGLNYTLEQMFWFQKLENRNPVDLRMDSRYAGRVQYHCAGKSCTLTITNVRESDSGVYKFRFITNQQDGRYTGRPGVHLSVTEVQVKLKQKSSCKLKSCIWSKLTCSSSCEPLQTSYIWYQNGNIVNLKNTLQYSDYFYSAVSLSCAMTGYKDLPSPIMCVPSGSCTAVSYAERSICNFKGSAVKMSCTYSRKDNVYDEQEFWFRQQETTTQPAKLQRDPRFVESAEKKGHYTLTIWDVTKSDSGEYRLKFGGKGDEWTNRLAGTTLKVTDPDIEVQVIWSPSGPKLICHSSCLRPRNSSFSWFKNEERIHNETFFHYGGVVDVGDKYSCVYEGYHSPSVYAPTIPRVLMNNSGDILKDSSMSLQCTSDANPPASYSWYISNRTLTAKEELVFTAIQPSDSGDYHCVAENSLGRMVSTSVFIDVKYAPKSLSGSVNPLGSWRSAAIGVLAIIVLTMAVLAVYLHRRRSKRLKQQSQNGVISSNSEQTNMGPVNSSPSDAAERQSPEPEEHHDYSTPPSFQRPTETIYSNIGSIAPQAEEVNVEVEVHYSIITFDSMARTRYRANGNEAIMVYSKVNTIL